MPSKDLSGHKVDNKRFALIKSDSCKLGSMVEDDSCMPKIIKYLRLRRRSSTFDKQPFTVSCELGLPLDSSSILPPMLLPDYMFLD